MRNRARKHRSQEADVQEIVDHNEEHEQAKKRERHRSWRCPTFSMCRKKKRDYGEKLMEQMNSVLHMKHASRWRKFFNADVEEISMLMFRLVFVFDISIYFFSFAESMMSSTMGITGWIAATATYLCVLVLGIVVHAIAHQNRTDSPYTNYMYTDAMYFGLTTCYVTLLPVALARMTSLWVFHDRYYGEEPYFVSARSNVDNTEKRFLWVTMFLYANLSVMVHLFLYAWYTFTIPKRVEIDTEKITKEAEKYIQSRTLMQERGLFN